MKLVLQNGMYLLAPATSIYRRGGGGGCLTNKTACITQRHTAHKKRYGRSTLCRLKTSKIRIICTTDANRGEGEEGGKIYWPAVYTSTVGTKQDLLKKQGIPTIETTATATYKGKSIQKLQTRIFAQRYNYG